MTLVCSSYRPALDLIKFQCGPQATADCAEAARPALEHFAPILKVLVEDRVGELADSYRKDSSSLTFDFMFASGYCFHCRNITDAFVDGGWSAMDVGKYFKPLSNIIARYESTIIAQPCLCIKYIQIKYIILSKIVSYR